MISLLIFGTWPCSSEYVDVGANTRARRANTPLPFISTASVVSNIEQYFIFHTHIALCARDNVVVVALCQSVAADKCWMHALIAYRWSEAFNNNKYNVIFVYVISALYKLCLVMTLAIDVLIPYAVAHHNRAHTHTAVTIVVDMVLSPTTHTISHSTTIISCMNCIFILFSLCFSFQSPMTSEASI